MTRTFQPKGATTGLPDCRAWLGRQGFEPVEGARQQWSHPDGRVARFEVKAWGDVELTISEA